MNEALAGDAEAADHRMRLIETLDRLAISDEAGALAERLIEAGAVPRQAAEDALHIAIAAVNGMDYLLTWNCRHIANARMRQAIDEVCHECGYRPPVICTPEELTDAQQDK